MKFEIIVSLADPASINIYSSLKEFSFKNVIFRQIDVDGIWYDVESDADVVLVLSTHSSESKKPCLSIHPVGNFREARLGGVDKELVMTDAIVMRELFLRISKYSSLPVEIEATHHGPKSNKPTLFLEIGSSEEEWNNLQYGKEWSLALKDFFETFEYKISVPVGIYIGGLHYSKARSLIDEFAIGHICAKYNLPILEEDLLKMISFTRPKVDYI
ncbi:MAG: D-aminoacyl-tRNA deacylase, partial [Candidatus Woesearchaeota archaeon]